MLSDKHIEKKYNEKHATIHVFNSILIYIKKIGFHFLLLFTTAFFSKNIKKKIIFFSTSLNNEVALSPIKEHLNESIQLTKDHRLKRNSYLLPIFPSLILSIVLLPLYIYIYLKSDKKLKKRLLLFSHDVLLSIGYDICVKYYLKYLSPKGIVFANDHIFYTRSLIKHAKKKEITSFYIQHSAVTEIFPPIISSFALLEGMESQRKYFPNGEITNNSFLIGSPKFDKYSNCINDNKKVSTIGICSTQSMYKDEVVILVQNLLSQFSNNIIFRPHPSEIISNKYNTLLNDDLIQFSNSLVEPSFDYLKKVDVVISGNSSILLEAAMLNVCPLFWNNSKQEAKYNDNTNDKYGFVRNNVVFQCDTIEAIIQKINKLKIKKPKMRNAAKIYVETIGTKNDGFSSILAANIIKNQIRFI